MRRVTILAALLGLLLPVAAAARVPATFVGMIVDYPVTNPHINLSRQFGRMVGAGVGSIRVQLTWALIQPYQSWTDVPAADHARFTDVGGLPFDFSYPDRIVGTAAAHGLTVLPVVQTAPVWAARSGDPAGTYYRPADDATYGRFLAVLAARYGPRGTFWAAHPGLRRVPVRSWQIWNEPNLPQYWPQDQGPSLTYVRQYVDLVHAAHDALKRVDRGATVVLAGMPNDSWNYLAKIYRVAGARRWFDVVAAHPFTRQPQGVITILQYVRRAMDRGGDRGKPILATEISYPSSKGQTSQFFGFETTPAGQAQRLGALLPLLARYRDRLHLLGFYHYNWVSENRRGQVSFAFAGLFTLHGWNVAAKPAYAAFRRAALEIEGCRSKGPLPRDCRR